jgi:hypothetical protein
VVGAGAIVVLVVVLVVLVVVLELVVVLVASDVEEGAAAVVVVVRHFFGRALALSASIVEINPIAPVASASITATPRVRPCVMDRGSDPDGPPLSTFRSQF